VKVNSYTHDEDGITTEEADQAASACVKLIRKGATLEREMEGYGCVHVDGVDDAPVALICFGSTAGVCREIGERLSLRVIRPIVLEPFPLAQFDHALSGVEKMIIVEENATGQLDALIRKFGYMAERRIGSVNGRPFTVDALERRIKGVIR